MYNNTRTTYKQTYIYIMCIIVFRTNRPGMQFTLVSKAPVPQVIQYTSMTVTFFR